MHSTEDGHVDYKKILAEIWKYSELYSTLAWAFKGAARCLTRIFPGQYHGKAVCQ